MHGALLDAELLAEVYMAMTRGQDSLLIDLAEAEPNVALQITSSQARNLKLLKADAIELAAHLDYIKILEKAGAKDW